MLAIAVHAILGIEQGHQAGLLILCCRWTLKQDNIAKAYAFLCVAHFFRAFPGVGETVMLKAFVNMVRMSPPDAAARDAVRQAIDLMVPILAGDADIPPSGDGECTLTRTHAVLVGTGLIYLSVHNGCRYDHRAHGQLAW